MPVDFASMNNKELQEGRSLKSSPSPKSPASFGAVNGAIARAT